MAHKYHEWDRDTRLFHHISHSWSDFKMHTLPFHTYKLIRSKYFSQYNHRVCKGSGKSGKAWSFILTFSRTGNTWETTTGPGKSWKSAPFKKYRERCFSSCHERGTKWKFLSPREESNRGAQKCFLCPTLVTRRKASFSISLRRSKLPISHILFSSNAAFRIC